MVSVPFRHTVVWLTPSGCRDPFRILTMFPAGSVKYRIPAGGIFYAGVVTRDTVAGGGTPVVPKKAPAGFGLPRICGILYRRCPAASGSSGDNTVHNIPDDIH